MSNPCLVQTPDRGSKFIHDQDPLRRAWRGLRPCDPTARPHLRYAQLTAAELAPSAAYRSGILPQNGLKFGRQTIAQQKGLDEIWKTKYGRTASPTDTPPGPSMG
jgi:hypothetical protein